MNPLSWMTLVFLLSAVSSLDDVNQNWLTGIVSSIRAEYRIKGQFCLAANIPTDLDPKDLHQVLQSDSYSGNVEDTVDGGDVYIGNNVVLARPVGPEHAERQVLTNLDGLIRDTQGKLLLIYSYLSPCDKKCTNLGSGFNIIETIEENVLRYWSNVAFVFTKVFDNPKSGSRPTQRALRQSLERLGRSGIGLQNIFRCDKMGNNFQCHSCSSQGSVSDVCVDNTFVPGQGGSSSLIRDRSSSRDRYNTGPKKQRYRSPSVNSSRDRYNTGPKTQRYRSPSVNSSRDRYNTGPKTQRYRSPSVNSSRDRYNTGPKKQRYRSPSLSSRGPRPRRNRSSSRRSSKRRSRSRMMG